MTNADDIELKEGVDLEPDINKAGPWKGSKERVNEVFTKRVKMPVILWDWKLTPSRS
jgi:hypothetical protein